MRGSVDRMMLGSVGRPSDLVFQLAVGPQPVTAQAGEGWRGGGLVGDSGGGGSGPLAMSLR
jgi:hypothetical protein